MDRRTANTSREPNEFVRKAAQAYNEKYGFRKINDGLYVAVDISRARRIADAYESLPINDSGNPVVRRAYYQLAEEIEQQWNFALDVMGMTFEPWRFEGQPYNTNSAEMCGDVRNNRHLYFFQGGNPHPLLGKVDPAIGLSMNDKFRAIHDLFGHAGEGYGFGPRGEENTWIKHSQMFRAEAQKALTTETRGQNSWINFGAHNFDLAGNHKSTPLKDRPYAVQKVALLPEEFMDFKAVMESTLNIDH
jgi:hypothetical protein